MNSRFFIGVAIPVFLIACGPSQEDLANYRSEQLKEAKQLISDNNYPEALKKLESIKGESIEAKKLYEDLQIWNDTGMVWSQMTEVRDVEIAGLYSGKFTPRIFSHDSLNKRFVRFVKSTVNRDEWIQDRKETAAFEKELIRTSAIDTRKRYGTTLRETYLDNNMDVKVKVSGKESDVLTLTYPLMSDVDAHQLKKAGTYDDWARLGFKKAVLRDGYRYSKTVTLD